MNKSISTFLALVCAMTHAQITITKDTSFGNNGSVTITGVNPTNNQLLLVPKIHSTFQENKIFVSYPSHDPMNPMNPATQFTRLNADGTLDTSFGNNGNVSVPFFESTYFYANNDFFYLNEGQKYLFNGQLDTTFGNNGILQTPNWNYKIVLSDGKIFSRSDANFSKYLSTGNPDSMYGTNGTMNVNPSVAGDPNSGYNFFFNKDNAVYESVYPSTEQSNIRKIDINAGNLDLSYGQNGYAQVKNAAMPIAASYLQSVLINTNDHSFINKFTDSNNVFFTKTNGLGNVDTTVGTNGVITASKSFNYNGNTYSAADTEPLMYNNNMILLPAETGSHELGISCYSLNGNNVTINSNVFYPLPDVSYTTLRYLFVKDQYLYIFYDNNITRYIIQQSVLATTDVKTDNSSLNFNNPFKDELSLNLNEKIKEVEILDAAGRSVMKEKDPKLNTSSLSKGVYLIKITTESNKIISKKGIKN